jgi:hypothetical protein
MKLSLVRDTDGKNCTLGKLYINDVFECHTLEDVDRRLEYGGEKIYGETAIPRGTYKVIVDWSQRFKRHLPRLLSVPQFIGILIHPGNTAADTHGCILVGRYRVGDGCISQSVLAFKTLFNKIQAAIDRGEEVIIEVR